MPHPLSLVPHRKTLATSFHDVPPWRGHNPKTLTAKKQRTLPTLTRCILLGAGASFGYDETLQDLQRPPLTNEVLAKAYKIGTFTKANFPNLYERAMSYFANQSKQPLTEPTGNLDVEKFLGGLADELEANSLALSQLFSQSNRSEEKIKQLFDEGHSLQAALGEMWYLLFDTLRTYSIAYVPNFDAYQRLALHYLREPYNVISLNYDTIFEMAILSAGLSLNYFPPNPPRSIPIAKVHGSIGWLNPLARTVVNSGIKKPDVLKFVAPLIYSNRFNMGTPRILDPRSLGTIRLSDLLRSGSDYDEPLLIPPIGNHKDYDKAPLYQNVWQQAAAMIDQSSELVFVGTTLRRQDAKLCEIIAKNLKKGTRITAVRGVKDVTETLNAILPWKLDMLETFGSFELYAKTL
jgi:hypothetical protein